MKFWTPLFASGILFTLFGCGTPKLAAPPKKNAIQYRVDPELGKLPLRFAAAEEALTATTADGKKLCFQPKKKIAVFQDCKINLPEEITLSDDGVYGAGKRTLQLLRVLVQNPEGRHFGRLILIDPGHGDHALGAKGKFLLEKEINLSLANAIATTLCERGFVARLSRSDDRFLSLEERVQMAKDYDVFISVHHNGSESPKSYGLETYAPDTPRKQQAESILLAFLVQRNMVRATKEFDRGVKTARFYVLEHTTIPAILIEAGFVTNPEEERKLNDGIRRQKIADAVADALISFYQTTNAKEKKL
ncbi:MAG: N-acetylmuramoyl-L-alanine amidase [Victivallaceae bacterium]|nr:N-acetylmuramoyl-L-alanine amidase [Victivallaceae bacterium]